MISSLKLLDRPPALSDQVYQALRTFLREGKFRPGQPLPEVSLAAQLGVSRTPVREALARLASEGLVVADGRSFVAPSLTEADIDEIYEMRFLLEPEAMRQVAKIAGKAAIAPITAALQASMAAHEAADADAFRVANAQFRAAWLALVPNARLARVIELYSDHVKYVRALTLGDPKVRSLVLRGQKRITSALAASDGDAAARAMVMHLEDALRCLRSAMGLSGREGPAGKGRKKRNAEHRRQTVRAVPV